MDSQDDELPVVCLYGVSALRFYMSARNDGRACWKMPASDYRRSRLPPTKGPSATAGRRALEQLGCGFKDLHVLVGSQGGKRHSRGLITHCSSAKLPSSAFYKVEASGIDAYVTSPELTFALMGCSCDELALIAAGNALCSVYRYEPSARGGVVNRLDCGEDAWTSRKKLESFARKHPEIRGSGRALKALRYVYDGARSPRESGIALISDLPHRLGGYALGSIMMNPSLTIFVGLDRYGHRRYVKRLPDIIVTANAPDGTVRATGIDYDPWSTHGEEERAFSDILRRNQIATVSSLTHITITSNQANNYLLFKTTMGEVRRSLHVRKGPRFGRKTSQAERNLRKAQMESARYQLWERLIRTSELFGGDVRPKSG